ncbi:MAG: hypothetical protein WCG23_09250 [bacterium]
MSNKNLKKEFEKIVPEKVRKVLYLCSRMADKLSLRLFLIGGVVRDIIICEEDLNSFAGKNHFDTDITVQGNAVDFANYIEKTCLYDIDLKDDKSFSEIYKIKEIHEKFKTVKVLFTMDNKEIELDIASTRKESYPYPGSLPFVEEIGCVLYEDVKRRDFSINSMALSLNKEDFGDLTDYLGGYEDIKQKKIRILHEKSFVDDPTRIIRALKFRVRFNYELDETTKQLQENCLASGLFDNACGERIKLELKQTFNLNKTECLDLFINENIYRLIDKNIKISKNIYENCESVILEYLKYINPDFIWLIYLGVMLCNFSENKILEIAEKLYLSNIETDILTKAQILFAKPETIKLNFEIYEFFEGLMPESILIYLIKKPDLKEKVNLYLNKFKDIKIYTTGQSLIDLGLKPGPVFGEILRALLKARINGEFFSEEEEKEFLKTLMLSK